MTNEGCLFLVRFVHLDLPINAIHVESSEDLPVSRKIYEFVC